MSEPKNYFVDLMERACVVLAHGSSDRDVLRAVAREHFPQNAHRMFVEEPSEKEGDKCPPAPQ